MTITASAKKSLDAFDPTKAVRYPVDRVFVRLPLPLKEKVAAVAKKKRLSINKLITHALVEFLKRP